MNNFIVVKVDSSRGVLTLVAVATFACVCCSISMRAARRIRKISSIPTERDYMYALLSCR